MTTEIRHKETFFQPAHDGIPSHWVVQYWLKSGYAEAEYFETREEAEEFEGSLLSQDPIKQGTARE